jgi:uncharacterized protein
MSEESVEVVRRGFKAFGENDFEAWLRMASEEIKVYPRREEPGVAACYEGWEGVLDYAVNWYSGWETYEIEAERFIDTGDYLVVDAREVGVAEKTGMRVEQNFAHAFKVRDGKIVEWRMFGPVEEALHAVGAES